MSAMQTLWRTWILETSTLHVSVRLGLEPYETDDPFVLIYEYEFLYDAEGNEVLV